MPATVIPVKGMSLGFVGSISNEGDSLRVPRLVKSTDTLSIPFGGVVMLNTDNTYSSVATKVAASPSVPPTITTPLGIAVTDVQPNGASFPQGGGSNLAGGYYAPGQVADVMVKGTTNVYCANGTPTAGGTVYIRVALNASIPAGFIGGLEATSDGANSVALNPIFITWKTNFIETDGTAQVTITHRWMP